jgi:hypothetical protein
MSAAATRCAVPTGFHAPVHQKKCPETIHLKIRVYSAVLSHVYIVLNGPLPTGPQLKWTLDTLLVPLCTVEHPKALCHLDHWVLQSNSSVMPRVRRKFGAVPILWQCNLLTVDRLSNHALVFFRQF